MVIPRKAQPFSSYAVVWTYSRMPREARLALGSFASCDSQILEVHLTPQIYASDCRVLTLIVKDWDLYRSKSPVRMDAPLNNVIYSLAALTFLFIYLFTYLLAALGLHCCARSFSSCGERGLLFVAVRGLLIVVASLVAEHGL